ncbi:MAG: hypothetical protein JXP34_18795 [Planctomycetes bacterium]|nr:hypothetical protein [Planctomycetota bacterium]
MRRIATGIVVAALAGAAPMASAEVSLAGLNLGTHVFGPKLEKEDLEGRIVIYEFWGKG